MGAEISKLVSPWKALASLFALGFFGVIKPLQFYTRLTVYILLIAVSALYGALASIVLTSLGKQGLSQWTTARFFYTLCRLVLGIKFNIINQERLQQRPAVFVSNHQTELDILLLGATFPKYCSVTAKRALKFYPFLGWFMILSGSVFIDRGNRNDAMRAFESASKQVNEHKRSVFMFPEGTRSYYQEPGLLPFKKGAFHFAVQAQVPLVPYVCSNYSKIFSFQKRIFTSGTIDVEVLEPIETKGMTKDDVPNLYDLVQTRMKETVKKLGYGLNYEKKAN